MSTCEISHTIMCSCSMQALIVIWTQTVYMYYIHVPSISVISFITFSMELSTIVFPEPTGAVAGVTAAVVSVSSEVSGGVGEKRVNMSSISFSSLSASSSSL